MVYYVPTYRSAIWEQPHVWATSDERSVQGAVGMRVKFTAPGQIIGLRYWRNRDDHGAHIGLVCPDDGARPVTWSMMKPPLDLDLPEVSQWHTIYLHPRYRITVGTQYEVGVWFETLMYGYEAGGLAADIVIGPITVPADGGSGGRRNGIYSYHGPTFGFDNGYSNLYAVDVVFLPG